MSRCLIRGSLNVDEYFRVKDIVQPGETISSTDYEKRPGGKGANQAVALAYAGASVDLVGAVGKDGKWVLEVLRSAGVNVDHCVVRQDTPSGRALIQLTERGQNSIILYKGANYSRLRDTLKIPHGTTHLLLQNEIDWDESLAWLSAASTQNIVTIFNPSPVPSESQLRAFPWDQLDWLVVNEGEAAEIYRALSGNLTPPPTSEQQQLPSYHILNALAPLIPTTHIVCTLGENGVLAYIPQQSSLIHIPAIKSTVLDTTGAGDCFTGYLVAGLMRDEEITLVLRVCVQASGMCVEKRGTIESVPLRVDVERRLSLRPEDVSPSNA